MDKLTRRIARRLMNHPWTAQRKMRILQALNMEINGS
jgi:hypothetical protein